MKLVEAVAALENLNEDAIICVRRPWSPDAECEVVAPDENLAVPASVKQAGFDYFLEVHVAKEVLGVFGDRPVKLDEQVRLLLFYAENDAFPGWVYTMT